MTRDELLDWLNACDNDPSIIHPSELGYEPDEEEEPHWKFGDYPDPWSGG